MNIQTLDPESLPKFESHPNRVLILGKSNCDHCHQWLEELLATPQTDAPGRQLPIGKLDLDQRGLAEFKKANPWLKDVTNLPFNVIYKDNAIQKSYAGSGVQRLTNRLGRLGLA